MDHGSCNHTLVLSKSRVITTLSLFLSLGDSPSIVIASLFLPPWFNILEVGPHQKEGPVSDNSSAAVADFCPSMRVEINALVIYLPYTSTSAASGVRISSQKP